MKEILKVINLNKSFKELKAVDNLSFVVESGKLFAFLGQNGAGKSTTINMVIGVLPKDSGEIIFDENKTFSEFKNKIGVVFQNNVFDDNLTVKENLMFYGNLYANKNFNVLKRYNELLELFDFKKFENKKFKMLSGGQKRKVEVARALFNTPEILFLDEPTTGLDPRTRAEVWKVINNIRNQTGMTVFLTTHYMEETNDADEVVIIHNGKIIVSGTPSELKDKYSSDKIKIVPKNIKNFEKFLKDNKFNFVKISDYYEMFCKDINLEIDILNKLKNEIKFFEVVRGSMDDVFLNAVGESLNGEEK